MALDQEYAPGGQYQDHDHDKADHHQGICLAGDYGTQNPQCRRVTRELEYPQKAQAAENPQHQKGLAAHRQQEEEVKRKDGEKIDQPQRRQHPAQPGPGGRRRRLAFGVDAGPKAQAVLQGENGNAEDLESPE